MVNVMIVEDQKLVRSILESYIKKEEGYELRVLHTRSGQGGGHMRRLQD